jgi:TetR/AcrR family acrAB operon transcriptional repressor
MVTGASSTGSGVRDNRARLLQLGAALFASQGYTHVSVRDLAARLGVSTGAIYSNFRSKSDLLAAILEVRIREDMERSLRSQPDVWLPEAVQDSFLRLPERQQMRALLLEASAAARTDRDLRESLRPTLTALIDRWVEDYRAWQRFGKVDPAIDMADLVTLLWSIELGLGVLEAQGAARSSPAVMADFVGMILESLEGRSGRPNEARPRTVAPGGRGRRRERAAPARTRTGRASPVNQPPGSSSATTPEKLVDSAMELFAEKGYAAVTVRDIARASGLTTGSLYGNFTNKADLLVEAIELRLSRDLELLPSDIRTGSPFEMIEFNLQGFPDRARLRALVLEGAAAARTDPDVQDRLREMELRHQSSWVEGFASWLEADGIELPFDSWTLVTSLWSSELGLGLLEALGLYIPPPAALAALFGRFFGEAGLEPSSSHSRRSAAGRQSGR